MVVGLKAPATFRVPVEFTRMVGLFKIPVELTVMAPPLIKVVPEVVDPLREISINDARVMNPDAELDSEVRFPKPVFIGDTLHVQTTVMEKRESKSRTDSGIVVFKHTCFNQNDEVVGHCLRSGLMYKKPART